MCVRRRIARGVVAFIHRGGGYKWGIWGGNGCRGVCLVSALLLAVFVVHSSALFFLC